MSDAMSPTDHDLLLNVCSDVGHLRTNIAELRALIQEHVEVSEKQRKDDSLRFRAIERLQERLQTRWQFFPWALGILGALSTVLGLIQYLK